MIISTLVNPQRLPICIYKIGGTRIDNCVIEGFEKECVGILFQIRMGS